MPKDGSRIDLTDYFHRDASLETFHYEITFVDINNNNISFEGDYFLINFFIDFKQLFVTGEVSFKLTKYPEDDEFLYLKLAGNNRLLMTLYLLKQKEEPYFTIITPQEFVDTIEDLGKDFFDRVLLKDNYEKELQKDFQENLKSAKQFINEWIAT